MTQIAVDRYAVFGHPIGHSKSPRIHAAFAEQTGQAMYYEAIEAPVDDFAGAWRAFVERGGRGANVTVPFKQAAFALADTLSARARLAGAVNTLQVGADGRVHGDTTDGIGLVRDLVAHAAPLEGARVLLLGAGGASRGVVEPLLEAGVAALTIANRTVTKAEQLAELFADKGAVDGCGFEAVTGEFDLVINATSASLAGDLPPLPERLFREGGMAYDMMYAAQPTVFLRWSAERGARTVDGLGMLIEQAAESFWLWRGVRPETATIRESLRSEL
ncbi:shikimate dehydrogenase [Salinicola rhizosphaerae]|uniref:Shikimate dehydrogenase (NADP(+)) n=1 Tax=Salinicola rhizosphaerae TaxID=1443141 RepID=A0ABQ3E6D8_9GAMM|nr:shikimate dehydrogenase [Salinicola rhizosphaerae]GHB22542.1 shikimate dehydrogenase (NADP(+)) [Salinicola rhizosphaerae]